MLAAAPMKYRSHMEGGDNVPYDTPIPLMEWLISSSSTASIRMGMAIGYDPCSASSPYRSHVNLNYDGHMVNNRQQKRARYVQSKRAYLQSKK